MIGGDHRVQMTRSSDSNKSIVSQREHTTYNTTPSISLQWLVPVVCYGSSQVWQLLFVTTLQSHKTRTDPLVPHKVGNVKEVSQDNHVPCQLLS